MSNEIQTERIAEILTAAALATLIQLDAISHVAAVVTSALVAEIVCAVIAEESPRAISRRIVTSATRALDGVLYGDAMARALANNAAQVIALLDESE